MEYTKIGRIRPVYRGPWSAQADYEALEIVAGDGGRVLWMARKAVPAGTALENGEFWDAVLDLRETLEAADGAGAAYAEMLKALRNLTDPVEATGNPVQAELVGGLTFDRVSMALEPAQSGSGEPSPDNIRPILGWTGAKIARCGKNLLDHKLLIGRRAINGSTGAIYITSTENWYATEEYIPVASGSTVVTSQSITLAFYDDNKECIKVELGMTSAVVPDNAAYFRVEVHKDYKDAVQIEYGSTATDYEPYTEDTYTADFGQTVYGGTLNWSAGVLTVEWACVAFTGNESFQKSSVTSSDRYWVDLSGAEASSKPVCSHAIGKEKFTSNIHHCYISENSFFSWSYSAYGTTTLADFKAYLAAQYAAGTPVQVAYRLAQPGVVQLDPQTIRQLDGVNSLCGDGGIAIVGRANPMPALKDRIAALEAAIAME